METLARGKFGADAAKIEKIVSDQGVGGLVIGLPLNMDGTDGPSAQSARAFARNFSSRAQAMPVLLWDERMSTAAVTRTLLDADASRKRRGEVVDKMAAAYILQGALERLRRI
jgi:putative Holliday junction resolvase